MSVAGAQRALVEEASNPIGTRKAQLETLRDGLLALRTRSAASEPGPARSASPVPPTAQESTQSPKIRPVITDRADAPGVLGSDCASILLGHLSVRDVDPRSTTRLLARVLEERIADHPAVVPYFPGTLDTSAEAFSRDTRVLLELDTEKPGIDGLVGCLATSAAFHEWCDSWNIAAVLFWWPERAGPVPPVRLLTMRAQERDSGLATAVCGATGEITAVGIARSRLAALQASLTDADTLDGASGRALADLLAIERRVVLLDRCADISPWTGQHWLREMEILWGDPDTR